MNLTYLTAFAAIWICTCIESMLSVCPGQPPTAISQADNCVEQELCLETPSGKIFGSLTLPRSEGTMPLALLISGSGPTDRDGNQGNARNDSLKQLAHGLAEEGFASLRYDKRGIGKSAESGIAESDLTFETYVLDAVAWVELLKRDSRFSGIHIIGHSEGSLIGMLAAERARADSFVSIAGVGRNVCDLLSEQLSKALPSDLLEPCKAILSDLKAGKLVENPPEKLNAIFRRPVQPYLISWFRYDPSVELAKLQMPVMIIHGKLDSQVTVDNALLLSSARPYSTVVLIGGMNHVLKELNEGDNQRTAMASPEVPVSKQLLEAIAGFVRRSQTKR